MTRQVPANTGRSQTKSTAIILKVAQSMSQLGIAALPRNYELVYEALSGRLPQLSRELAALGATPQQDCARRTRPQASSGGSRGTCRRQGKGGGTGGT